MAGNKKQPPRGGARSSARPQSKPPQAQAQSQPDDGSTAAEAAATLEAAEEAIRGRRATQGQPASPADQQSSLNPDQEFLAHVAGDIAALEEQLDHLTTHRDEIEAVHVRRSKSPLTLRLEVVGCQFASEIWPDGQEKRVIPQMVWGEIKCPFGKTITDQECRDCAHHKIIPLGANEKPHTRRYVRYPSVIPIPERQAEVLGQVLKQLDLTGVQRVDAQIAACQEAITNAHTLQAQAQQREIERQQRGQV